MGRVPGRGDSDLPGGAWAPLGEGEGGCVKVQTADEGSGVGVRSALGTGCWGWASDTENVKSLLQASWRAGGTCFPVGAPRGERVGACLGRRMAGTGRAWGCVCCGVPGFLALSQAAAPRPRGLPVSQASVTRMFTPWSWSPVALGLFLIFCCG